MLALVLLPISWWLMMAVHELGHVLGAWASGGRVRQVDLHPLQISQTTVEPNPHPLFVAWSGPLIGACLPLMLWFFARRSLRPCLQKALPWMRFFAGFCLVANGVYLGSAVWEPVGDAADLVHYGVPVWQLVLFGTATFCMGIWLWHGLGRRKGPESNVPGSVCDERQPEGTT